MSTSYDKAGVIIKIDEEIVFNDFVATNLIADTFFKSTNIVIPELIAIGLEVKLLRGETVEYTALRNGVEHNIVANPKIGDLFSYTHHPQAKDPNQYFELTLLGNSCTDSILDAQTFKIDGANEHDVIDVINKITPFLKDDSVRYIEEFNFSKNDDNHADGDWALEYEVCRYIKFHSYGKVFIADIEGFIKKEK